LTNNSNKHQGIGHLIGVFLLPTLIISGFFIPWIIGKIIIGILFIGVVVYIWKYLLKS